MICCLIYPNALLLELLIGEVMHFTIKFLILVVFPISLSGCAGLYNCSRITDNPSAFQECQAKNGNQEAQYKMGLAAFNDGKTKTAIKWLKKAAKDTHETIIGFRDTDNEGGFIVTQKRTGNVTRGHYKARMLLAHIYENGIGVEVDKKKAERYR